ncbi:SDR family NAD(P)-dependent oxidoreductase [Muricoccus radiodurans]|uniref:SDR family NAD(P)-dependent oxidoreductase n=1 Tax=Muricoccus radiodurans TaxID=2231721 RepID=UPI003CF6EBA7
MSVAGLAIVSGASSGIGWHVARLLLAREFTVLAIARDAARLRSARDAMGDAGPRYCPVALDVRDGAALREACAGAIARHGAPRWVVASAGIARPGRFLDIPPDEHEGAFRTNYLGSLHLAQACLPAMVRARGGRLVFVSSAAALGTFYGFTAYAPSKLALRALGDGLALEMAPHGVGVTTVFPPDTDTPQLEAEMAHRPPVARAYLRGAPVLAPEAVARALLDGAAAGRRHVTPGLGPTLLHRFPRIADWIGRRRQARLAAVLDAPDPREGGGTARKPVGHQTVLKK